MDRRRRKLHAATRVAGLLACAVACSGTSGGASAPRQPGEGPAGAAQTDPAGARAPGAVRQARDATEVPSSLRGRWQPDVLAWAPAAYLVGADGNAITVVNADANQVVARQVVEVANPVAIAASPDGKRVIVADTSEKGYLLWDAEERATARFNGHADRVVAVAMSPDGKLAASVAGDGRALLWDLAAGKQISKVEISDGVDGEELSAVAFAHQGRGIALGTVGGNVGVWDPDRGSWRIIARHASAPEIKPSKILPAVKALAFTADGQFIVSGGQDQYVLLSDPRGQHDGTSAGPYEYIGVQAVAVSQKSDLIAIAHADGIDVVGYRLARKNGRLRAELSMRAHIDIRGGAQSLAFSPDGQRLAASILGEGVSIWEVATGESYPLDPRP